MRAEHLIIGAGMAGLVLRHFLRSDRVVLIDQRPGAYKIGESVVPEQFEHPIMRALLPKVRALPSCTIKHGTTFVSEEGVASFPLPPSEVPHAMHVARAELEQLMAREWEVPIAIEKVVSIDLARKVVRTDRAQYEVEGLIIDCSGPAMVLASMLGDVSSLWPVWATWGYLDVVENVDERFQAWVEATGRTLHRYDAPRKRLIEGEVPGWSAARSTILSRLGDGVWTWQIPLYGGRVLSFGVVSRHGTISPDTFMEIAMRDHAPNYRLAPRPPDEASPMHRIHTREGFARRAHTAATKDYVLLADSYAFADPVYSVGTALAVNKAIQLSQILRAGPWTEERAAAWCADAEHLLERAIRAFNFWYSGTVMRDDAAATEVRDEFLVGNAFQVSVTDHYGDLVLDSSLTGAPRPDGGATTGAPALRDALDTDVRRLLGLAPDQAFVGWQLTAAGHARDGVELRFGREDKPDLRVLIARADGQSAYKQVGALALSYLALSDRDYPFDATVKSLLDQVALNMTAHQGDWRALQQG